MFDVLLIRNQSFYSMLAYRFLSCTNANDFRGEILRFTVVLSCMILNSFIFNLTNLFHHTFFISCIAHWQLG